MAWAWWDKNIGTPVKRFIGGEVREAKKEDKYIREEYEGLEMALETGSVLTPGQRLLLVQQGINLGEQGTLEPAIGTGQNVIDTKISGMPPFLVKYDPVSENKHLLDMQAETIPNISLNQTQQEINENPMMTGDPVMTVDLDYGNRYTNALLLLGAGYLLLKVLK